ncbi:MAG TPA: DNA-directed RNA polymerase subunit alpha [Chitinophagales bacterium]|nr:DNA-directed RNA polymerase subunit alpha [Chitinophagales bacterium]MCB9075721.1 DNA-directed RNA polymerase subunit alpha [Chitinophagales bacterium]HMU98076.1 DNA-directed RNA polymerase subunit alpha [Chitinophagales bacterium]HMV03811.1 DNA-directed RNA polymerase subunit alpha [Chitinophagales bacterium]HMW95152.1 DNA-directed RNA polymerase subunit alpha [Chitinophagales bacterium]
MAILSFQKPDKILLQKATDFEGTFEFAPLEPGFGNTVGNALRRVLLSSLEGYAITSVKISGVQHEFSTIKGVIEDVTEIILNLKQVRLKRVLSEADAGFEKVYISLKGKDQFVAGDIVAHTNVYEVTNPELVICNMDKSVSLELELTIGKGRGYVPAEEHFVDSSVVGIIPVDSIYTPIKNVKYKIENTRVEQRTDFEKLIIDIKTDGTIHPEDAIKEAAKILIQHLILVSDENITFETESKQQEEVVDEHILHMRKILKTNLEDMDLSVRAFNCLKAAKINSLSELVQYDTNELLKFRNFGRKSLVEIEELIIEKGLHFGMDLSKFKLED